MTDGLASCERVAVVWPPESRSANYAMSSALTRASGYTIVIALPRAPARTEQKQWRSGETEKSGQEMKEERKTLAVIAHRSLVPKNEAAAGNRIYCWPSHVFGQPQPDILSVASDRYSHI